MTTRQQDDPRLAQVQMVGRHPDAARVQRWLDAGETVLAVRGGGMHEARVIEVYGVRERNGEVEAHEYTMAGRRPSWFRITHAAIERTLRSEFNDYRDAAAESPASYHRLGMQEG